ncbi:caspase family protein [Variovorax paradoxus]|nr:caspase family protein [Variovorax paradoxus]MBT2303402.1 caspase family protein [Variovorax paradoxus]
METQVHEAIARCRTAVGVLLCSCAFSLGLLGATRSFAASSSSGFPATDATVALATQSFLPLFIKSGWTASSFSPDGHFLFVVDGTRSFILDALEGRELRAAQVPKGDTAIWSRPVPVPSPDYRWLVATSQGRLLEVDGRTGRTRALKYFPPTAPGIQYKVSDFQFEFATQSAIVVNLNRKIKRKEGATTRTIEDRRLLWQPLDAAKSSAGLPVSATLYFANLTSFLSVNPESQYVALASRDGTRVVLWRIDARAQSQSRFSLACVYDGDEKVRAIASMGRGFIVVDLSGKAYILDPQASEPGKCTDRRPMKLADVKCKLEADISVIAGRGKKATEMVVVTKNYSAVVLDVGLETCALSKTALGNVKEAFFAAPIFGPADLRATEDPEWDGFVASPADGAFAMVAGTSLLRLNHERADPTVIQSLSGRPTGAVEVEAGPGFIVASRSMAPLRIFDVSAGALRTYEYDYHKYLEESFFYNKPYAIAGSLGAIAILERDGQLRFHEARSSVDTAQFPKQQKVPMAAKPNALCSSEDGHTLWVLSSKEVNILQADNQGIFAKVASANLGEHRDAFKIACAGSGTSAVVSDSLSNFVFVLKLERDVLNLVQTLNVPQSSDLMVRPSLSPDSRVLAVGSHLYVRATDASQFIPRPAPEGATRLVFNQQADMLLAVGRQTNLYKVHYTARDIRLRPMPGHLGAAEDGAFIGEFVVLVRNAEHMEVLTWTGSQLGRLVFGDGKQWLFTDGHGRFDTYDPEGKASAYWVVRDDLMRALDPELFMREYWEPRLLPRLMDCHLEERKTPRSCKEAFPPTRSIDTLNRARPDVEIFVPEVGPNNTATLRLRVSGTHEAMRSGSARSTSGAFDLHVRLNGQLVARLPAPTSPEPPTESERADWRKRSHLLSGTDQSEVSIPGIRLPHLERDGELQFSAYAYNEDGVKSITRTRKLPVQASKSVQRRAFVVAIGSSAYEDQALDLRYPAEDARALLDTVVPALRDTKRFTQVIPVPLTSEWKKSMTERHLVKADTTKARIRQVLEAVAGSANDPAVASGPATPDDTVIILFSGHGLNYQNEFYLVPYNSGPKSPNRSDGPPLDLTRQISSAELAYWLRDLVADEIVLVIDACHSSASVESPNFKPGPMGARGLGQLAYDKGMRVLASTRPNDLAWESQDKGQGLLSYALLQDGLAQRKADRRPTNGSITVGEWLQYAVDSVPELYGQFSKSPGKGEARLVFFDPGTRNSREVSVNGKRVQAKNQQPSVFDFRRGPDTLLSGPLPKNPP